MRFASVSAWFFQNPDNQIVATIVEEDVAFGPENLGMPPEKIRQRVDDALKAVGMYDYRLHAPNQLSGGPKQRVAHCRHHCHASVLYRCLTSRLQCLTRRVGVK